MFCRVLMGHTCLWQIPYYARCVCSSIGSWLSAALLHKICAAFLVTADISLAICPAGHLWDTFTSVQACELIQSHVLHNRNLIDQCDACGSPCAMSFCDEALLWFAVKVNIAAFQSKIAGKLPWLFLITCNVRDSGWLIYSVAHFAGFSVALLHWR